jgi:hypothetical protein
MAIAQTLEIDIRRPYLIDETSPGKFYIVERIKINRNDVFDFEYFSGSSEDYLNVLNLGEHMIEDPNKGIELVVECGKKKSITARAFWLIRTQAQRDGYDYVSFQPYRGTELVSDILIEDEHYIGKVMPRLFRMIPKDDTLFDGDLSSQN